MNTSLISATQASYSSEVGRFPDAERCSVTSFALYWIAPLSSHNFHFFWSWFHWPSQFQRVLRHLTPHRLAIEVRRFAPSNLVLLKRGLSKAAKDSQALVVTIRGLYREAFVERKYHQA